MNDRMPLTDRLDAGPVICAEGFLFELERRGYLTAGEFVPEVALEYPDALRALHVDYQRAGSDIVEAFTYNGHREKMRVIGKEDLLEPLNRAALQIAREVADAQPGNLMAGNISNSNIWDPADPQRQGEVRGMFEEMVGWAVEGGADLIIGETFYYAGEALAALEVAKSSGLPVVLTIAPMALNEMADGVGIVETCQRLEQGGADVVGMNCFRGPQTMLPWLREIRAAVSCHVGALPIPYRTTDAEPTFFNLSDPGRERALSARAHVPDRAGPAVREPLRGRRLRPRGGRDRDQLPRRVLWCVTDADPPGRRGRGAHHRGQPVLREDAEPLHVRRQRASARPHRGPRRPGLIRTDGPVGFHCTGGPPWMGARPRSSSHEVGARDRLPRPRLRPAALPLPAGHVLCAGRSGARHAGLPFLRMPERIDYGPLVSLLAEQVPDDDDRRRILWDTPAREFGFTT